MEFVKRRHRWGTITADVGTLFAEVQLRLRITDNWDRMTGMGIDLAFTKLELSRAIKLLGIELKEETEVRYL